MNGEEENAGVPERIARAAEALAPKEWRKAKDRKISALITTQQHSDLKELSRLTGLSVNELIGMGIDMLLGDRKGTRTK